MTLTLRASHCPFYKVLCHLILLITRRRPVWCFIAHFFHFAQSYTVLTGCGYDICLSILLIVIVLLFRTQTVDSWVLMSNNYLWLCGVWTLLAIEVVKANYRRHLFIRQASVLDCTCLWCPRLHEFMYAYMFIQLRVWTVQPKMSPGTVRELCIFGPAARTASVRGLPSLLL